jgi:hypothetical protein
MESRADRVIRQSGRSQLPRDRPPGRPVDCTSSGACSSHYRSCPQADNSNPNIIRSLLCNASFGTDTFNEELNFVDQIGDRSGVNWKFRRDVKIACSRQVIDAILNVRCDCLAQLIGRLFPRALTGLGSATGVSASSRLLQI